MISADPVLTMDAPGKTAAGEVEEYLAELRGLAGFYEEDLLSDEELAAAKEKLRTEDEAAMDSLWY